MNKNENEIRYQNKFIKEADFLASKGKHIAVRPEYHERIKTIAHAIGECNITISDYLDNVLREHFSKEKESIVILFKEFKKQLG